MATDLIAQAFRQPPTFRQRFDSHVRKWRAHVNRQVWINYHTDPAFAAEYDRAVQAFRERIAA